SPRSKSPRQRAAAQSACSHRWRRKMNLQHRTWDQLLADFGGELPQAIKMLNLIYSVQQEIAGAGGGVTQEQLNEQVLTKALAEEFPLPDGNYLAGLTVAGGVAQVTSAAYSVSATGGTIAQRQSGGVLVVGTATNNSHAVTLAQLNGRLSQAQRTAINALPATGGTY